MTSKGGGEQPAWNTQVRAMPEVLTVEEAAVVLRMSPVTVRQHARAGNLPGVTKLGKKYLFSKTKLLEFLQVEIEHEGGASGPESVDSSE